MSVGASESRHGSEIIKNNQNFYHKKLALGIKFDEGH
jgi:hypothetical protein